MITPSSSSSSFAGNGKVPRRGGEKEEGLRGPDRKERGGGCEGWAHWDTSGVWGRHQTVPNLIFCILYGTIVSSFCQVLYAIYVRQYFSVVFLVCKPCTVNHPKREERSRKWQEKKLISSLSAHEKGDARRAP